MKMRTLTLITASVLAGSLLGCSVQNHKVPNNPPVIKKDLVKYSTEFGTIIPDTLSVFLWPDYATESEITRVVREVNTLSTELEALYVQNTLTGRQIKALENEFDDLSCAFDYAEETIAKGDVAEWVTIWKDLDETATEEEVQTLAKCKSNQEEREPLYDWVETVFKPNNVVLTTQIFSKIDPDTYKIDPKTKMPLEGATQINYKPVERIGSSLTISPKGVDVELMRFDGLETFSPSTKACSERSRLIQNATYYPSNKLLRFTVPAPSSEYYQGDTDGELNPGSKKKMDPSLEGAVYVFSLERAPDLIKEEYDIDGNVISPAYARFIGDVKLMKDGVILRHGSAKIIGNIHKLPDDKKGQEAEDGHEDEPAKDEPKDEPKDESKF